MIDSAISVRPLTPAIGAVIDHVDLSHELSPSIVDTIRAAFLEHQVVFFNQQDLTPKTLVQVARSFGEIGYYPFVEGMRDFPEVVEVEKKEGEKVNFGGLWHTDTSYLQEPPLGSLLYALDVPPIGGDTLFSNMYLAYDALSNKMKDILNDLKGVNSAEKPDAALGRTHRIAEKPKQATEIITTSAHPLVRTHPETGRKALYCSAAHTMNIEGMTVAESAPILNYLYNLQQREEFTCRFHWKPGSLAFWDNRAAQHNALNDYHGCRRMMYRVTLKGDRPA